MKVNIEKQSSKLIVRVVIEKRTRPRDLAEVVDTKKVLAFLRNNGYNDIENYTMEKEGLCSSLSVNQVLTSEWVFEKKKSERSRNAKAKTTTKSTKPAEKPATKRRSTRRSSTKSKEDKLLGAKDLGGVQSQT